MIQSALTAIQMADFFSLRALIISQSQCYSLCKVRGNPACKSMMLYGVIFQYVLSGSFSLKFANTLVSFNDMKSKLKNSPRLLIL